MGLMTVEHLGLGYPDLRTRGVLQRRAQRARTRSVQGERLDRVMRRIGRESDGRIRTIVAKRISRYRR